MEPSVTTSFIPKRPIESSVAPERHSSGTVGLLSLLTAVVVIGTITWQNGSSTKTISQNMLITNWQP